jgi:phospholipid N-methyltransferase
MASPRLRVRLRRPVEDPRVVFFRSFLRRPREVGSIIPSSRFLERRVVRCADTSHARCLVELGPGTGGTTRALLAAMAPDARLLSIEINPRLAILVRQRNPDPRLTVHQGSAADIAEALSAAGLGSPDVVLSGIPFSTLERSLALAILRSVRDVLAPGGRFVAYQVRDRVAVLGRQVFGRPSVQMELRNVPPMRIYCFEKPSLESAA